MKISIIIPVYNIEKYIGQCIESVLCQSFGDYELLLVDDGSSDSSGKICDNYSCDERVKVFHISNGGPSRARNYGIEKASGQYVIFMDGDDYLLNKTCLQRIVGKINEADTDFMQYRVVYHYDKNDKDKEQPPYDGLDVVDESPISILRKLNRNSMLTVSPWDKVIKRDFLIKNRLFFREGILSEDLDWTLRLYLCLERITLLNDVIYVYRQQRPGSTTYLPSEKRIKSLYDVVSYWYNYEYPNKEVEDLFLNIISYQYIILLTLCKKSDVKKYLGMTSLLQYDDNYKVKLCNRVIRVIGLRKGIFVFRMYLKMKNNGWIKL